MHFKRLSIYFSHSKKFQLLLICILSYNRKPPVHMKAKEKRKDGRVQHNGLAECGVGRKDIKTIFSLKKKSGKCASALRRNQTHKLQRKMT